MEQSYKEYGVQQDYRKEPEYNLLAHIGVVIGEFLVISFMFGVVFLWMVALN